MNLTQLLKAEISRVARKEIKAEILPLKKASSAYRSDIAELKRRIAELERKTKSIQKSDPNTDKVKAAPEKTLPFSALRFAAWRRRMDLSAPDLGLLLGVSSSAVYNWEGEKTRPRPKQIQSVAALRQLGKSDLLAQLLLLRGAGKETSTKKRLK